MPAPYGIRAATEGEGLLPWGWAAERLAQSRDYWLATSRPDGRPHVAVIWGVWLHDHFFFETSPASRKGRNLAANPRCVVCLERADEAVTLEGVAEVVDDPAVVAHFATAYAAKYREEIDTDHFSVYRIRPVVAFATISDAARYSGTATRWRFPNA
jgi:PPOX class probable F420-dependent enzyme